MSDFVDLSGKLVVVAGASSGIGEAVARTVSDLGARVALIARREDKLKLVLADLRGEGHEYYCADLSDLNGIEDVVKAIVDKQGAIDGLVYAAGIGPSFPIKLLKPDKLQQVFQVNYFGFVETVRQVTKRNRFNSNLHIVGVSSTASKIGDKAHTAYASSKAAMNGAVRCLAKELASNGVLINVVEPGMTNTPMYESFLSSYGEDGPSNARLLERQYLGVIETADVSNAIAFLLSDASRFITGQEIPVDGGSLTAGPN